ncbi:hypothetical protein AYI69_g4401 [Smittium culicis]|uniref:Uncharacterized protein n=1 Tax=Smittium culicis TaxID=133412 RepID=A0A1R1YDW1_9FUNG|nr:hypothetical protein AYI69_g4401 [Smittium culicis]
MNQEFSEINSTEGENGAIADNSDHLGDIFLPTSTFCLLPKEFTNPIQRIFLSANGNLQRLLSSYYNSKVDVEIVYNKTIKNHTVQEHQKDTENYKEQVYLLSFERKVNLICKNKKVVVAKSKIHLLTQKAVNLITEKNVGISQFFSLILQSSYQDPTPNL